MTGFLKWAGIALGVFSLFLTSVVIWGNAGSSLELTAQHVPPAQAAKADHALSRPFSLSLINPYLKWRTHDETRAGYSMSASHNGTVQYALQHGVADLETRTPIDANTRFRIASMTKPITATAAMILIERGIINLDDPVADYIPAFATARVWNEEGEGAVPLDRPITIEHILTFTAGIGSSGEGATPLDRLWAETMTPLSSAATLKDRANAIAALPLYNQPGEKWHYGLSLNIMARIIEVASGQPYEDFLQVEVFEPLGMANTSFMPAPDARDGIATLYTRGASGDLIIRNDPEFDIKGRVNGDGRLVSTLPDYMRFALMLWNKGRYQGVQLLSEDTVTAMTTPYVNQGVLAQFDIDGLGWGYGLAIVLDADKTPMPDKNGDFFWSGVNGTHFWISPQDGTVFVYMTQYRARPADGSPPRGAEIPFVVQAVVNGSLRSE